MCYSRTCNTSRRLPSQKISMELMEYREYTETICCLILQVLNECFVRVKNLIRRSAYTKGYRSRHLSDGNIIVDTAGFGSHGC